MKLKVWVEVMTVQRITEDIVEVLGIDRQGTRKGELIMTDKTPLHNGQIWQDADPRIEKERGQRRLLRIVAVGEPGPHAARVVSWYEEPDGNGGWRAATKERPSTVSLARFVPNSTGYRLFQDVEG